MNNIDIRYKGVNDEGGGRAIVEGNLIRFAINPDPRFIAATDEDELIDRGRDLDKVLGVVKVLDDPFITVKLLSRGLLAAHALGLLARQR